jgi:hypothetical protein
MQWNQSRKAVAVARTRALRQVDFEVTKNTRAMDQGADSRRDGLLEHEEVVSGEDQTSMRPSATGGHQK